MISVIKGQFDFIRIALDLESVSVNWRTDKRTHKSTTTVYYPRTYKITEYRKQNEILVAHLTNIKERMKEIQAEMKRVEEFDNDLRDLADLPRLDEDLRSVGIGGSIEFENFALRELPSPLSENSVDFRKLIKLK